MATDKAHDLTDAELAALEYKIEQVYRKANSDLTDTIIDYFQTMEKEMEKQQELVKKGKLSEEDYENWYMTAMARGERYERLQERIAEGYTNANETAMTYVNEAIPNIYSINRNYAEYTIEQAGADIDFVLWDEATVRKLIMEEPDVMPYYPEEKAVARGIDLAYGKEQIQKSVTSGILQGKSAMQIADDLQKRIEDMNRVSALRAARTAFTEAENAGRQDAYEESEKLGIEMQKEWMATLDSRTRASHGEADGQRVDVDKPFIVGGVKLMFPGDSAGAPAEVYNCRCTMVTRLKDVDEEHVPEYMTYNEWLEQKKKQAAEEPKTQTTKKGEAEKKKEEKPAGKLLTKLKNSKIAYNAVDKLKKKLTDSQIIKKLGGGDLTIGSCASLAFAYMGNKAGFDVTDYRGGKSRDFFSYKWTMDDLMELKGVDGYKIASIDGSVDALKYLDDKKVGEEYCLSMARHRAIVKRTGENEYQYLELQSADSSGWQKTDAEDLADRFGMHYHTAETLRFIKVDSLKGNTEFQQILGYLNTDTDKQKKGASGSEK